MIGIEPVIGIDLLKDVAQLGMSVFGLAALGMAYSGRARLMKWSPLVGLTGQPFWAVFAWVVSSWALALLVPAFSAVYLFGVWRQWELRRWIWRRFGSAFLSHPGRCAACGAWLTADERHYYEINCNRCDGIAMQEMERAMEGEKL